MQKYEKNMYLCIFNRKKMNRISAIIITHNEERNIGRCIESLNGVADEIIVVDSGSTDATEAICLGLGVEPEHVRVVVPLPANMPEITRIIREEIEYDGVSVIIPRRECMQTLRRHKK